MRYYYDDEFQGKIELPEIKNVIIYLCTKFK